MSKEATLVMSSSPPLPLLARMWEERHGGVEAKRAMENLYDQWQERWTTATTGGWTRTLIRDSEIRRDRLLSNADRLSGNGAFRSYIFRFYLTNNFPLCAFCGVEVTAEHALFLMLKVDQETGEVPQSCGNEH